MSSVGPPRGAEPTFDVSQINCERKLLKRLYHLYQFTYRMGQYASGSAPDMLGQARALFALCEGLDMDYMARRIAEETAGTYGLQDLQAQA